MAARAASLVQADYDRAVAALVKAGQRPEIIFDITNNLVRVTAARDAEAVSTWQNKAPDRV